MGTGTPVLNEWSFVSGIAEPSRVIRDRLEMATDGGSDSGGKGLTMSGWDEVEMSVG